ncbi:MAG: HK97 family phage prohead protease [Pseudomonadota bacterium]
MLFGAGGGEIELEERRSGRGVRVSGRFPYRSRATVSDGGRNGGRPRKETFEPRAFTHNIEREEINIRLLSGHRFDKPLADQATGSLELTDSDAALTFRATIAPEVAETSHGADALALLRSGLARGVSPGFRLPPRTIVPDAEEIIEEDPREGRALIRVIKSALLFELSLVTSAAYPEAEAEERSWELSRAATVARQLRTYDHLRRWRL